MSTAPILLQEIRSQPAVLTQQVDQGARQAAAIGRALNSRSFTHVIIAARGTSDNAARYAKYVWGAFNRLPVALSAPSLYSLYGQFPDMRGALVVGISQSGQSSDIVGVLSEARRQGCPTLAICNDPDSPSAR